MVIFCVLSITVGAVSATETRGDTNADKSSTATSGDVSADLTSISQSGDATAKSGSTA